MANNVKKANHSGAKNGGGHWGTREEAKVGAKKLRRSDDLTAIVEQCRESASKAAYEDVYSRDKIREALRSIETRDTRIRLAK